MPHPPGRKGHSLLNSIPSSALLGTWDVSATVPDAEVTGMQEGVAHPRSGGQSRGQAGCRQTRVGGRTCTSGSREGAFPSPPATTDLPGVRASLLCCPRGRPRGMLCSVEHSGPTVTGTGRLSSCQLGPGEKGSGSGVQSAWLGSSPGGLSPVGAVSGCHVRAGELFHNSSCHGAGVTFIYVAAG